MMPCASTHPATSSGQEIPARASARSSPTRSSWAIGVSGAAASTEPARTARRRAGLPCPPGRTSGAVRPNRRCRRNPRPRRRRRRARRHPGPNSWADPFTRVAMAFGRQTSSPDRYRTAAPNGEPTATPLQLSRRVAPPARVFRSRTAVRTPITSECPCGDPARPARSAVRGQSADRYAHYVPARQARPDRPRGDHPAGCVVVPVRRSVRQRRLVQRGRVTRNVLPPRSSPGWSCS